jgi:Fis family transcriptional regulator
LATNWTSKPGLQASKLNPQAERGIVKDQLEGLVSQMVERGILFEEAIGEFEKRFIKRTLERAQGNQCRAAKMLGIHRNTLSRKIGEYKLDRNGSHRR